MARPIEYNKQEFLDKATELFLEKGYKQLSMRDILWHTGLNRHSIYRNYKSKKSLYLEILKNYRDRSLYYGYEILEAKPYGIGNIKKFYAALLSGEKPVSCLMMNTIADCDLMDRKSLEMAMVHFKKIEKALKMNYEKGIEGGSVSPNKICSDLAAMTVNYMQGLPISSKTFGNQKVRNMLNKFIDSICR